MKKTRILCLLLAAILVVPMIVSCSNTIVSKNVTIKFQVPKEDANADPNAEVEYDTLFEYTLESIEGPNGENPNVLQVAETALKKFEKDYELSKDGTAIASAFERTESQTADATTGYFTFWDVAINGKKSDDGRQSVTYVYDNDVIVYTWTSGSRGREDTDAVVTTDPNNDTTAVNPNEPATTTDPADDLA